jgi:hypothetical protein
LSVTCVEDGEGSHIYSTAFYCSLLRSTAFYCVLLQSTTVYYSLLQSTAVYCSLLQSTAVYCSLLPSYYLTALYYFTALEYILVHSHTFAYIRMHSPTFYQSLTPALSLVPFLPAVVGGALFGVPRTLLLHHPPVVRGGGGTSTEPIRARRHLSMVRDICMVHVGSTRHWFQYRSYHAHGPRDGALEPVWESFSCVNTSE